MWIPIEGMPSGETPRDLAAENAKLREALSFYGDEENYRPEGWPDEPGRLMCRVLSDEGERARVALGLES